MLGADGVEDREDLVLLDELAGLLERPRQVVAVVAPEVLDLAPVDAAVGVDVLEVGVRAAGRRCRTAEAVAAQRDECRRSGSRSEVTPGVPAGAAGQREARAPVAEQAERGELHRETVLRRIGSVSLRGARESMREVQSASAGSGRAGCPGFCATASSRPASSVRRAPLRDHGRRVEQADRQLARAFEAGRVDAALADDGHRALRGSAVSTATRRDQPPVKLRRQLHGRGAEGLGVAA